MLVFNVNRIFKLRGIDRPFTFLVKNGFATSSASNMLRFSPLTVKIKTMEKLCLILKCTPNDLFEWRDDKGDELVADQPLNSLRHTQAGHKVNEILKEIPLEKIGELESFLETLKENKDE